MGVGAPRLATPLAGLSLHDTHHRLCSTVDRSAIVAHMAKPAPTTDLLFGMATGGLAPAMAAFVTNPADVAKTRLNMSRELQRGRIGSVVQCWRSIVATEGFAGLQRGLGFVLVREASKNAFRLGLYEPLVGALDGAIRPAAARDERLLRRGAAGDGGRAAAPPTMASRVAAGAISGGLAAFLCNPLDLLKTRIQLDPARGAGRTAREALQQLVAAEGVVGLWRRGVVANVARSATATSLGLPVNYRLKDVANAAQYPFLVARPAVRDAACALAASVVARCSPAPSAPLCTPLQSSAPAAPPAPLAPQVTVTINPIDLVRTRLFSQPPSLLPASSTPPLSSASPSAPPPLTPPPTSTTMTAAATAPRYRGVLDCARRVAAAEGVGAFWKGSFAAFLRIGPHQTLTFVIIGFLRRHLAVWRGNDGRYKA